MLPILVTQLVLPVALVAWLAATKPSSRFALVARLASSLLILWAIARVGVWVFPPWWTPVAAAVVILGVAMRHAVHNVRLRVRPLGWRQWSAFTLILCVGLSASWIGYLSFSSRSVPAGVIVDLALPFEDGRFLVVNGGAWEPMNAHRVSVRSTDPRFIPWRGNGWAVDLVAIDRLGRRSRGILPEDPSAYVIFGMPVVAPCAGEVVLAVDGRPDMHVPQNDRPLIAGNHVILACGDVHVVMAHLRHGSVRVVQGERVGIGLVLGQVGNSGGSDEPHLHIHAQRAGPPGLPVGGDPVPVTFGGRFLVRGDRVVPRNLPILP